MNSGLLEVLLCRSDYRPISLLPFSGFLISADAVTHLASHDILSNKKYCFRFARSIADESATITEFLYQALRHSSCVSLDILKVFNMVLHFGLVRMI